MSTQVSPTRAWRRVVARTLVVIASVLAFVAIFAIWLNRQALNTDNWTRTSSELLQHPVIRDQMAARLSDELFASVDVEQAVRDVLPARADVLAAPAANALRTQVEKRARKALARPDAQVLWANANRSAHEELMAVLRGGGSTVSTDQGKVVLDLRQLLGELQSQVGVGGRLRKVLPASATRITLLESSQLSTAQSVVKALRPLAVALILASLALASIALAIAPGWRRRGVRAYGIGFLVAGAAALLVRSVVGGAFVSSLASTAAAEPAVNEIWVTATGLLVNVAVAGMAYGAVMVTGAWLAGPTRLAVGARRALAPYLREPVIAYTVLAVVVAAVVWWAPTPAWRNAVVVALLAALLAAGVEALRRQMIREFPEATQGDAKRRYRERWTAFVAGSRRRGATVGASASRAAQSASGALSATSGAAVSRFAHPEDERLTQLERLARLREAGVIDDDDLRAEKQRILHADQDQLATT
jgi:hypothetical protein